MVYFVIPCRKGSKGFPLKNRYLIKYVLSQIPEEMKGNIIISTDDDYISLKHGSYNIHHRPKELASDIASMKHVLQDISIKYQMNPEDKIFMLYTTYPQRTWKEILNFIRHFKTSGAKSQLCKKGVKNHPYLCIDKSGKQIIKHNLCRRQDYPEVFEISHYMYMCDVAEIPFLNNNLYNDETNYILIDDRFDIDSQEDYDAFKKSTSNVNG